MGKPLADPEAVRAENMRLRAEGTIVVTKRALAAAKPRAFIEFAEKTLALEEWARRFNARGLKFRLFGAPRTKKNHSRLKWAPKKKRTVLVPSAAYEEWCNHVCVQLATMREPLPDLHYNCAAVFYRDADRGDAVGYYQGLADALEAAGVLTDDKLITRWDGSRLDVDRANPRVELTLTPVSE
jgi:Holliday junction resolvase RusA-like endonuclease